MKIDKITTYYPASSPSRSSSSETNSVRMIPLSLPRIMWLERDDNASNENAAPEPGDKLNITPRQRALMGKPLNKRERECIELRNAGETIANISKKLGMDAATVRSRISAAKAKLRTL